MTHSENNLSDDPVPLLTGDGGAMATSKMLGVPYQDVPESWRLQPEKTEADRELGRLQEELYRLKLAEPQIAFHCESADAKTVKSPLNFERPPPGRLAADTAVRSP